MSCLYYYIVFTIIWALPFWFYSKSIFGKRYAPLLNIPKELFNLPKSKGFVRHDRKNWNFWEFFLTGTFLLPLRLLFTVVIFITTFLVVKVLSLIVGDIKDPVNFEKFHQKAHPVIKIASRI